LPFNPTYAILPAEPVAEATSPNINTSQTAKWSKNFVEEIGLYRTAIDANIVRIL